MTSIARLIRVAAVLIAVAAVLPSSAGRIPRPKTKTNPRHRVRSAPPRPLTVTPRLKVKGAVASGAPYAASLANALASKKRLRARAGEREPSVHDFCPIIAYWNAEDHAGTCEAFADMQEAIFYYNEEPECAANNQIPLTTAPAPLTALPKPIAPTVNFAELAPVEGATYAWNWRMLRNLIDWWPCYDEQLSIPAGYRGVGGDVDDQPGAFALELYGYGEPFMAAVSNGAHLAVAVRGTSTDDELELEFAHNLVNGAKVAPVTLGGRSHAGATRAAQQLWPGLKAAIDAEVLAPGSNVTRVTVTGYSLGGAIGTILSAVAAEYIATATAAAPRAIAVEGVFFGSSTIGDAPLADWVAARVNLRSLAFENDVAATVPCESMPACANTPVPTDAGAEGIAWTGYTPTRGRATILATAMPTEVDVWASTEKAEPEEALWPKLLASHSCAYTCALAKYGGYASDECHIGAGEPEPGHTACPSGPVVV